MMFSTAISGSPVVFCYPQLYIFEGCAHCLFLEKRGNPEDSDSTDNGCSELSQDAAPLYAEQREQPAAERTAKETEHYVHDDAETTTFHQLASTEASQTSKKK